MTDDKEMALKIGNEVLRLRLQIAALKGVLMNYRDGQTLQEIPWPAMVDEAVNSPLLTQTAGERRDLLASTLDLAKDDSQLIRALHEAVFFPAR
jgi:hypothetical protein